MKKKNFFFDLLACLLILVLSFFAFSQATMTSTSAAPSQTTNTQTNWWEAKWGQPQYGGTVIWRYSQLETNFLDPLNAQGIELQLWTEMLFGSSMTADRNDFSFSTEFTPTQYMNGWLADSWEVTDQQTVTVHLRKGIHWQDKPPVNGREFTAEDVVYTYDRLLGTGSGFTTPFPFYPPILSAIKKVTAVDNYTVQFSITQIPSLAIFQIMQPKIGFGMVAKEWVELGPPPAAAPPPGAGPPKGGPPKGGPPKGGAPAGEMGPLQDWKNAVGTGAFILTDVVAASNITFSKNTNYWDTDERYPDNRLPYLDTFKIVAIPDMATSLAALRTGKIDLIVAGQSNPTVVDVQALAKTDPDIQVAWWSDSAMGLHLKYGVKPFDDIRVRKAMQMAIDLPTIAAGYAKGTMDGVPVGISSPLIGKDWVTPYNDWPQELKDEYTYNVEKAKKLMSEAGYPDGFDTHCIANSTANLELPQIYQAYLKEIGINMEIRTVDGVTMFDLVANKKIDQILYAESGGLASYPSESIRKFMGLPFNPPNGGAVDDPTYNAMVERFFAATTVAEAQTLFKKTSQYALEQHWVISGCSSLVPGFYQSWIKGYSGEYMNARHAQYFRHIWIDQSYK